MFARLLVPLLLLAALRGGLACFSPCSCTTDSLDCSSRKLETILDVTSWLNSSDNKLQLKRISFDSNDLVHVRPLPALGDLEYLSFRHNRIQKIEDSAFQYLQNMTELDISHNQLASPNFSPHIFMGMFHAPEYLPLEALRILRVGSNVLHSLSSDVFEHIPHLEVLSLDNNPFKHLDLQTQQAITSLKSLKVLDLSFTELYVLPQYLLHTPNMLLELNLTGNRFTTVPEELMNTHGLSHLSLSQNPITTITAENGFPRELNSLRVLEMNWMPNLTRIEKGALSGLVSLEEFHCSHNHRLVSIDGEAFSHQPGKNAPHSWPPLRKMYLKGNGLTRLDSNLVARWDEMQELDIEDNEWVCDCENQWMISILEPLINYTKPQFVTDMYCVAPEQMKGQRMFDLHARNYHLRCLDADDNHPEHDGMMLIGVLVGVLLAIPATLAAVIFWRRGLPCLRTGPAAYSRAFYSPADGEF